MSWPAIDSAALRDGTSGSRRAPIADAAPDLFQVLLNRPSQASKTIDSKPITEQNAKTEAPNGGRPSDSPPPAPESRSTPIPAEDRAIEGEPTETLDAGVEETNDPVASEVSDHAGEESPPEAADALAVENGSETDEVESDVNDLAVVVVALAALDAPVEADAKVEVQATVASPAVQLAEEAEPVTPTVPEPTGSAEAEDFVQAATLRIGEEAPPPEPRATRTEPAEIAVAQTTPSAEVIIRGNKVASRTEDTTPSIDVEATEQPHEAPSLTTTASVERSEPRRPSSSRKEHGATKAELAPLTESSLVESLAQPATQGESSVGQQVSIVEEGAKAASPAAPIAAATNGEPSTTQVNHQPLHRLPEQIVGRGAERATGPSRLTDAEQVRILSRVAKAFQSAQQRDGEVRIRLSPPELGSLRIEIRVEQGVLRALVEAETPRAQTLLVDNLPALKERLAEQNIRVEQFDVSLMDHRQQGPADGQSHAHEAPPLPREPQRAAHAGEASQDISPPRGLSSDGRLNVMV